MLAITIDNPPLNAINAAMRGGLLEALERAAAEPAVAAVVLRAAGRTFSAGGDLREVGRTDVPGGPPLALLNDRIELFPKPVVVAMQGRAIGGGVLLAMAAHARIGTAEARLALPEVRLGFVPGAGGTQRLPRLVGLEPALEMAALAQEMPAARALACGLLDAVMDRDPLEPAMAIAGDIAAGRRAWRRTRDLPVPIAAPDDTDAMVAAFRARAGAAFPHREAPATAIDLVAGAAAWPFEEGVAREQAAYARLSTGPQARALLHLFFAERGLRLPEGIPGGRGPCRLLPHDGTRIAEILVEPDASPNAIEAAAAEARTRRLIPVAVRAPIVARLRAAMTQAPPLASIRAAARDCLAEGLADAAAIDFLAVEVCGYPAHLGGPLHHAAHGAEDR